MVIKWRLSLTHKHAGARECNEASAGTHTRERERLGGEKEGGRERERGREGEKKKRGR